MPIPETTSAEGLEHHHYSGGTCLAQGKGIAWRDIRASVYTAPARGSVFTPSISEPALSWTRSGELEVEDREIDGPWTKSLIKKGSIFLISGGAPYYCRWNTLSKEPHQYMLVVIALPIIQTAMEERYGRDAKRTELRDVSGFQDPVLSSFLEEVYQELFQERASALRVQGLARLIAVHLVRNYTEKFEGYHNSALPGFKLRKVTAWMAEHRNEKFALDRLAKLANLSRFHFNRLFKKATGMSPSQYHIALRLNDARRLLRETSRSVIDIAMDVGYSNPSHFAHLFRRDAGLSPSDYRRQR